MISIILYIFTSINLLIYLYIIVAVAGKWKVSKAHRRFFIISLLSFLWVLDVLLENTVSSSVEFYKIIAYSNYFLAALIAGVFASFALHFPKNHPSLTLIKELIFLSPTFILALLSFTNIIIKVNGIKEIQVSLTGYSIYIGILIFYFIIVTGYNFINKYKTRRGITRQQLLYIIIGYLFSIIVLLIQSIITNIYGILPSNIDLLITNSSILFSILVAYAMLRYRFMDIKVVIRKGFIFVSSLIIVLALYTYLALFLKSTIDKYWNISPGWTAFILVCLVALGFPPLKNIVERSINTLFKGKKSIDLAVKEVQEKMANKTDIEALIDLISQEIRKFLGLEEVEILLINRQEKKFIGQEKSLDFSQAMVQYLQEKGEIVVKEEIPHMLEADHEFDYKALKEVEAKMNKLNIAVAVPVGKGDELISLILLGKKKSQEAFTVEDIKFLERLSGQALFALGNAVLYRDAMARIKKTYLEPSS